MTLLSEGNEEIETTNKMSTVNETTPADLTRVLENTKLTSDGVVPNPSSIPSTLARSFKISGSVTDSWVQIFADRIVVGVSQRNKRIGNWCLCQAAQSPVDPKAIDFQISTVLGDRNDAMIGVYGRRIVERIIQERLIPGSNTISVLLGISLQDKGADPSTFKAIVDVLVSLIGDTLRQIATK